MPGVVPKSRSKAFTVVELLIVIGILVVLIGLLLPTLEGVRWSARNTHCKANLRQHGIAFNTYALDNQGWYPHPNVRMKENRGERTFLRPIQRVHNGFVGGVGDIFYPYLPAHEETIAQIDRYRSKAKTAAMNHPVMRCPEAENLFRYWREEIDDRKGGLTNFENNQTYAFYANCSSGIDSGYVPLTHVTSFAPTEPQKMLRKINDTMIMKTDVGPKRYTILSSDIHLTAGAAMVNTWHGRTAYRIRDTYYNNFYFYNGSVMPNFTFADGSVKEYEYHTSRRDLMYVSKKTQGLSASDGYMLPREWSQ